MDFILRRMIADVGGWYDRHYQASPAALAQSKRLHTAVLRRLYDPARFARGDPEAARIALLTETQRAVNHIRETVSWI